MKEPNLSGTAETFSLFGGPLYPSPIRLWLPDDEEAYREKLRELRENYDKALREYLEDPDDPERIIWLGRRTGILGRFMEAASIYSTGIEKHPDDPRFYRFRVSDTKDSIIAATHWLCMVLFRLGRHEEAEGLLESIKAGLPVVEVGDYYETLLMYKGETTPEGLLEKARGEGPLRLLTRGQAVGNLYLSRGETGRAAEVFRETLETGEWTAGVYLLAEAELKRLGLTP